MCSGKLNKVRLNVFLFVSSARWKINEPLSQSDFNWFVEVLLFLCRVHISRDMVYLTYRKRGSQHSMHVCSLLSFAPVRLYRRQRRHSAVPFFSQNVCKYELNVYWNIERHRNVLFTFILLLFYCHFMLVGRIVRVFHRLSLSLFLFSDWWYLFCVIATV